MGERRPLVSGPPMRRPYPQTAQTGPGGRGCFRRCKGNPDMYPPPPGCARPPQSPGRTIRLGRLTRRMLGPRPGNTPVSHRSLCRRSAATWSVGVGDFQTEGRCVTPPVKGLSCCTPCPNVPASYLCSTNVAKHVTHPVHRRVRTLLVKGSPCRVSPDGWCPLPDWSPSQGLNGCSHLWGLPVLDPLPPHKSVSPRPLATDTTRNLPYWWRSSGAETSTVGPPIFCPSLPRRPQACPT